MPTVDISSWSEVIRRYAVLSNPYREFERAATYAEEALSSLEHDDIRTLLEFKRKGGPGGRHEDLLPALHVSHLFGRVLLCPHHRGPVGLKPR